MESEPSPEDSIEEFAGIRILVEPGLAEAVVGVSIDYVETGPSLGFIIVAPNAPPPG
ncbi:MAG: hypothetical protein O3B84_04820 [Chloroflexi bacterium]|nr:hypothetical protein [Chloroflexota bacterium]